MSATMLGLDVPFREAKHEFENIWAKFEHTKETLPEGWQREPGYRALPQSIIWERDAPIPMRDGKILRGDVFRLAEDDEKRLPAIVSWSPYGKTDKGFQNAVKFQVGVARDQLSGLEQFEGLDPAEWCPRGYAICNIDARGAYDSEGDIYVHGTQEGQDGHDTVEWIASQPWSNGSVGLAGNSWLACSQWATAAEKPPHLKAIAPWEGATDYYRHILCRGGVPRLPFVNMIMNSLTGHNKREDTVEMYKRNPLWSEYWDDKRAKIESITIPMSILASYSSAIHTEGSIRSYLYSKSEHRWLRIHTTQEWNDLYSSDATDDLQRFFDRYLKGIENDWELTPKIRLSLLRYNGPPIKNRPESAYPPARVQYRNLYLDTAGKSLKPNLPSQPSSSSYQSDSNTEHGITFTHTFDKYTELVGFSKATIFASAPDHDDLDIYLVLRKLDRKGKPLLHLNIPLKDWPEGTKTEDIPLRNIQWYIGPTGMLRASQRETLPEDPTILPEKRKYITPTEVYLPHRKVQKLTQGEIVKLEIQIWPGGMVFYPGESLQLGINGHEFTLAEFANLAGLYSHENKGKHNIHTGGEFQSFITLPLID